MCNHQVDVHLTWHFPTRELEAIISLIYRYLGTCCTSLLDFWAVAATYGCRRLSRIDVPLTNWHAGRAYDAMQPVPDGILSCYSMEYG